MTYRQVTKAQIPNVRFDVPRRNQGQIIEIAYAWCGSKYEADEGAPFKRVTDRSTGAVSYYVAVEA